MSFLDDLKKEAEQVKQQKDQTLTSSQAQRELVVGAVRPRLKKLYEYLKETCGQLNVVNPDVHMSFQVRGFGKLGPLRQHDYKVTAENPDSLNKFTVSFVCSRPDQIKFQVEGKDTAVAQKEYLWSCNLRFTSKLTADGDGVFFMDAFVPITLEFEADLETAKVHFQVRNLEALGATRMVYDPDMIDDEFMEELAKWIVRKDNRFQELSGNTISKMTRMELAQRVQMDKLNRDLEASSNGAHEVKKKKKKGLLRSLFGG
jgi:hypothetical protein